MKPSRLKLLLANKSLDRVARNLKTQILKNFLNIFLNWDIDPLVSRENLLYELAIRDMRLDWPVTKSPKQGNIVFESFDNFCKKQNTFQKQLKHSKIFVFDQQKLSMWKHI